MRGESREVKERRRLRWIDLNSVRVASRAARVAGEANVILDDAGHRVDRLQPNERVGRAAVEHGAQRRREPAAAENGNEVSRLPGRVRRHGIGRRFDVGGAGGVAGWHLDGADERVTGADRAAREIVGVGSLAGPRLVRGDVRVAANVEQPAVGIVNRDREVTADAVAVVEVEDGSPGLLPGVHTPDRLDLLVIQREGEPVDVALAQDVAGDADRVAIGLEQVADVLSGGHRLVAAGGVFARLADERRVSRQPLHVEPDRRIPDVGVADGRTRLLVKLTQSHAQLIGSARRPAFHLRGIDKTGLVDGLVDRCHAAVGSIGGDGLVLRLAPHAYKILDRCANRPPVARQHDPHPGILWVDRVVIPGLNGIPSQRLRQALRVCFERCRRVGIRE